MTKRTIDDGTCSQLDRLADSLVVAAMALKYSGEGGAGEGVKAYEADTLYHVLDGIAARLIDMTREAKETA